MNTTGRAAIWAILAIGVIVFILLMISSLGLQRTLAPNEALRVSVREKYSAFDRARAMEDLRYLAEEIGPRPVGSEAGVAARDHIVEQLRAHGVRAIVEPEVGQSAGANVYAELPGRMPAVFVLAVPLTTPAIPEFTGANLTASPSAWLLEMARTIKPGSMDRTLYMAWLDGEFSADADSEAPYTGTGRLIAWLRERDLLDRVQGVLYVGAIGDCYLNVTVSHSNASGIAGIVEETAKRLGYGLHFALPVLSASTTPWQALGVPMIMLHDTSYGPSPLDHQRLWLTAEDTVDLLCPESLQAVADVVYHAFPAIEGYLNSAELGAS